MRCRSTGAVVLGLGLTLVSTHALAAEPAGDEGAPQPGDEGYIIARGAFDPTALCSPVGDGCSVLENQIVLVEDVAIGKLHGGTAISITYSPSPDCKVTVNIHSVSDANSASRAATAVLAFDFQRILRLRAV